MIVFACSIIAKSQCWLFALRANTGQISVFAYISVFAPEFNFRYQRSGLKVEGKMMHKDLYKIVFQ